MVKCITYKSFPFNLSSSRIFYFGPKLTNIGINTNTSLEQILQHLNNIWTSGGGGGGHIILNSGTPLTQRLFLNFTNGLTASDDALNGRTEVVLGGNLSAPVTFTGSHPINFYNSVQRFLSLRLRNTSNTFEYRFVPGNITGNVDINIPLLNANDTLVFENFTQSIKNKTLGVGTSIAIGGDDTGDLYSNVSGLLVRIPAVVTGNVLLSSGASSVPVWGKVTSAHVDGTIVTSGQAWMLGSGGTLTGNNVISGSFSVTFSNSLQLFYNAAIRDSSDSFNYILLSSSIAGNRNITLPSLTSDDVFVFESHPQIISNKTIGSNTSISLGSDDTGDIYYRGSGGLLTRLPDVVTGNVLLSGGVGAPPFYGKVTSSHVDSTIQLSGLSWLLSSGGALTGHNNITGSYRIGFDVNQIGVGLLDSNISPGVRFEIRGIGTTNATLPLRIINNILNELFSVYDNGEYYFKSSTGALILRAVENLVEVGGNAHLIKVPPLIGSGAAKIEFRDNIALAYILGTSVENYLEFRSLTGDKAVKVSKKFEVSQESSVTIQIHYETVVPATALATTVIGSFPLPNNNVANIESSWIISATDGNSGGAHVRATVKNIGGTTSLVGIVSSETRVDIGVPVFTIAANDTTDTIEFSFTNAASPHNRAYKVNISAIIHLTPGAS